VLKEGALLVMPGLLAGAPGIYLASGLIRGPLVGVSPSDPLTLLAAALGLLLVTMSDVLCARVTRSEDRTGAVASSRVSMTKRIAINQ
jgi:hypothetical protein